MLVVSGSALTTLRLFGVVLDDYFLSIVRLSKNLEVLEVGIFSWSDLPGQDTLTMASSSQFDLLPVLRCLRIKLSLGNTDGWTPHSGTCVPQIGFANATLAQAVKLRRRHRSLDFSLTLEGGGVDTWEPLATLCNLCESGLVQRKGYAVEYREGGEFLDQLDNEWHSNDDYYCEPQPKPCVDCARRKEDEEFWRVGGV
ncbi:hypothetical protein CPB85DRAFT_1353799 [Mucidula mucida]|nr:hypothetical protein CPB85DRAFT_1353799 [Mucidula mucida]